MHENRTQQLSLQTQAGSLSSSFLQRTRYDVVRLRAIVDQASNRGRSAIGEAQRIAHAIHGAAALFGFPRVSATGGAIERLCESMTSNTAAACPSQHSAALQQLIALSDQLNKDLDACDPSALITSGIFQGMGGETPTECSSLLALPLDDG